MGFQACSNDEVDNVKTTTSNDVEAISASSSLITSEEAKNNIPAFTEAIEAENTLLDTRGTCALWCECVQSEILYQ